MYTLYTHFLILIVFLAFSPASFAQKKAKPAKKDSLVVLKTTFGEMVLLLYEETPKHRANFLKLTQEGFYEDLLFHRIIKDFMIQGGDPDSRNAKPNQRLGSGGPGYRVDAEFNPKFIHKKGALAAARSNNPQKASSGCQFYIVQGRKVSPENLKFVARQNNVNEAGGYTEAQIAVYDSLGGTPHLDQNYTVYGEVISGLEALDKIIAQKTNSADRPIEDIKMNMTLKVLAKKKISKMYGYTYEGMFSSTKRKTKKKKNRTKTKTKTKIKDQE